MLTIGNVAILPDIAQEVNSLDGRAAPGSGGCAVSGPQRIEWG